MTTTTLVHHRPVFERAIRTIAQEHPDIAGALRRMRIEYDVTADFEQAFGFTENRRNYIGISPEITDPDDLVTVLLHEGYHAMTPGDVGTDNEYQSMIPALTYWNQRYPHGRVCDPNNHFCQEANRLAASLRDGSLLAKTHRLYDGYYA